MSPAHKLKLLKAKKWLGWGWVLHPSYSRHIHHAPAHHDSYCLAPIIRTARAAGRI